HQRFQVARHEIALDNGHVVRSPSIFYRMVTPEMLVAIDAFHKRHLSPLVSFYYLSRRAQPIGAQFDHITRFKVNGGVETKPHTRRCTGRNLIAGSQCHELSNVADDER